VIWEISRDGSGVGVPRFPFLAFIRFSEGEKKMVKKHFFFYQELNEKRKREKTTFRGLLERFYVLSFFPPLRMGSRGP
jgi:hypothetical protein